MRAQSVWWMAAVGAALAGVGVALLPLEALFALGAVLVGAFALLDPALSLALTLVLAPLQPLERIVLGFGLGSGQVMLSVALIAYLLRALATWRLCVHTWGMPISALLAAFASIAFATFFVAQDAGEWLGEWVKWLQFGAVALIVANASRRTRALLLGAVLVSGAIQAAAGFYQAVLRGTGPDEFLFVGSLARYRAYGSFEQPNPFGGFMGLVWPVALGVSVGALRQRRWFVGASALLVAVGSIYALIASGSRGAFVGAAAAALALVLVALPRPQVWALAALTILLALYGFDRLNLPASIEAQVQAYMPNGELDVRNAQVTPFTFSTIERLAHWQAALRMIEASPWLGVGLGNYAAAYPRFRLLPWENPLGHAHNYYLNVFAEGGVLGLLTYLAFWVATIAITWRQARAEGALGLMGGILGAWAHLSVHQLFDNLYVANMHLLLGAYLGFVMAQRAQRQT
ncbi:MAG: O-antigen ligase family protein, partial [Anaerolineae bacterium]|nr:O-antigen ligase family protein [Thermoflexales bacterium]MDW8054324.1 O-antigen ligase family protein [Anaerolineae bacterium]